jgi:kynurenine formamidase
MSFPSFSMLPIRPDLPPHSAWGVFGDDDQVGTLNHAGGAQVRSAARLVQSGRVFSLNWSLDLPSPPILGRGAPTHHFDTDPGGADDWYDNFYPQASSQWDALSHIRHPEYGFYNGTPDDETPYRGGSRLAVNVWAQRGIASRFVLADVAGHRSAAGDPIDASTEVQVSVDELEEVLDAQHVELRTGDILLLNFGWIDWYETADSRVRERLGTGEPFPCPGLSRELRTAEWLWDHKVAAVAADSPAVESMPFSLADEAGFLHYRLIPLLGLALGEMFHLEPLAEFCRSERRYTGLLTAAPLNKPRGVGSTANALALM